MVLSRGWAGLRVPDTERCRHDAHVVSQVPHSALFPQVQAVVHHGGVGTAGTAARAGVPQLIVPHAYDQHASAHRLQQAGVAHQPIPRRKLTARTFAAALAGTLADEQLRERARSIGNSIAARDPLGATIAILESAMH